MAWLALALGIAAVFLIVNALIGLLFPTNEARDEAKERLDRLAAQGLGPVSAGILRQSSRGNDKSLFERLAQAADISEMVRRAGLKTSGGTIVLAAAVAGLLFYILGLLLLNGLVAFLLAPVGALLPYFWLKRRVTARMKKFERQLPDALDLVGRALMAGHAFTGSLRMIADECDDPIGPEFAKTLDEINFGLSVDEAMNNLLRRIDSLDLKLFVVSVHIQRESGGNLTELVTCIATLIRERFKLAGKIRTLSAEGKLSAIILVCLPFAVGLIIYVLNPGYISVLWTKELGKIMLLGAGISMAKGIFWIRRMVNIQV
ncbi:Type II secretion system F domain-containing protein [Desulfovibrio sp. X2]|uniref:type II secretion system F family protein n=1 Tax=Desulfovibrio sp. X2 TaxID=941449 RepID=UPI000358AD81|nr:type II secretion system F family protein [Desulfovibrio sp. X2]EPR44144.1 Type II secretion system F domain-containing protein [Desulfovibrio sp. X2]